MTKRFYSQKALAVSFIIAMAMVALEVSAWIAVFSFVMLFWKWGVENLQWKPLSRKATGILSVLLLIQVLVQFRTLIGQEPAYTFLLALSSLRIMDYQNERDHKFVILLGFLLISVKALFSLDIYWIIPSVLAFVGLWYSLLPESLPARAKVLLKIFILSVPMAVILFFAFPRFVLPWAMSRGSAQFGEIGFTDEINPGMVAELATNTATAFRAKIENLPINKSVDLYWRGSVLTQSRGLSWRPRRLGFRAPSTEDYKSLPTYEVAIEPTSQLYLFVLEGTKHVDLDVNQVLALPQNIYRSIRPLNKSSMYRGYYEHDYKDRATPQDEDLQVPPVQGRVHAWVDGVLSRNLSIPQKVEELQKLFVDNGFVYTLSPGVYGPNDLETFLFERKRGFCEHFAGAYATLARSLGIPARVIVGYQGGRFNPLGNFWKVSQKDAHAWVEIFNEGQWQRIDPTLWVAPLRLVIGAEEFFGLSEEDQRAFARAVDWRPPAKEDFLLWDEVSFWVEDINYRWTYFLIDFDKTSQQSFWSALLNYRIQSTFLLVVVIAALVLIFRSLFKQKRNLNEAQVLLQAVEKWAEKKNIQRENSEPPLEFLKKLQAQFPYLKMILQEIETFYDEQTYAGKTASSGKELLTNWKNEIRSH
ncbi:cysteine protease [Bdellovibrio bacteriovorus]|uniref:Cysteine protease n=1 Tax=Bdellovibrio bacteriovorus TaxID=959 RepID=A0A150WWI5_BDEBC|nr:DUF3488 and transglutaminase-like domain-containing protein [Bdellovibrio bacteriovorus]KYG70841.1 cysteine protease [Bdellovibrio bacteriovorus]